MKAPHRHQKVSGKATQVPEDGPLAFPLLRSSATKLPKVFADDEDVSVLRWLQNLETPDSKPRWLAWHQLYIDFQLEEGRIGPWKPRPRGREWRSGSEWKNPEADYRFQQFSQWFSAFVLTLARSVGDSWELRHMPPQSHCYVAWSGCLRLPMSQSRWERLENAFQAQLGGVIRHLRRDLADLRPFF